MFQYRSCHPADLAWLDQAVAAAGWESLDPKQRMAIHPVVAARQAQVQLRQALFGPGTAAVVAEQAGMPVGYAVVAVAPDSSTDEPTAHLLDVWVAPLHRRRGAGTGLLRCVEQLCARQGLRKIKLWSGLHNRPLVAWAERSGFAPAGLIGAKDL